MLQCIAMQPLEEVRIALVIAVGCLVCGVAWAQDGSGVAAEPVPSETASAASSASATAVAKSSEAPDAAAGAVPDRPLAGYSWSDAKRPSARKAKGSRRAKVNRALDPAKPLATSPGFMLLPDGRSVVWLYVSRAVIVSVARRNGSFVVNLPGVQVGVRNNTNPLETAHFPTTLERAHLAGTKDGAALVLQLREDVAPVHEALPGPRGTMVLRVTLPKPTRRYAPTPIARPGGGNSDGKAVPGATGPGPRP